MIHFEREFAVLNCLPELHVQGHGAPDMTW